MSLGCDEIFLLSQLFGWLEMPARFYGSTPIFFLAFVWKLLRKMHIEDWHHA